MEKAAITVIVFGAMSFVLGLIPGLLGALRDGLRNFRSDRSSSRGPIRKIKTDMRLYGNIWLVVGGGGMIILGLVALS